MEDKRSKIVPLIMVGNTKGEILKKLDASKVT